MPLNPISRDLAIRTLLGEAGNEPQEGQIAVANVMKNRTLSGAWGDPYSGHGLADVIRAPKQFSLWNPGNAAGSFATSISTADPRYQRAGQIIDAVFNNQLGDNTGGATHYYNPSVANPDWGANGTNVRQIGAHRFMTLPLNASNTGGTAVISPSTVGMGGPTTENFAYGGATAQDQGIDTRHLEPVFKARIDQLMADAAAAGIKTHIVSGYRDNQNQAGLYAKYKSGQGGMAAPPGASYHNFGRAVDVVTDDPRQQSQLTALAAQPWRNIRPGATFGDYDHYEAVEGRTAPLVSGGQVARAGPSEVSHPDGSSMVGPPAGSNAPLGASLPGAPVVPAPGGPPPAAADVPAAQAQPVAAKAPASQPAAFPGAPDANSRYQVLQGMTTGGGGQGGRNPFLYTALNLGGSSSPAAPAVGVQTARPDLAQRVPLDQAPQPPLRPADLGTQVVRAPAVPPPRPTEAKPALPMSSIVANWGATTPSDPATYPESAPTEMPSARLNGEPAMTRGGPSMGYPAMTPSPNVLESIQRLLQGLFPT